ncbi:hypothetical protein HX045_15525 [Myroides odoratimimus]|uniref:hypothetical protein n=1 Tax=Myroides odoratimimus TaxID=76832 RepID=UPI002575FD5E|nr:hypothetical protein [Myroides odoratimimus]MDM1465221.1 hypothetical protein [Myroides odoratimimus]MDM1475235.1 hypothetical protein [Myroides odoratimimus]MDM1485068.1 hypothetical protein [Myroides odoratimimus]
MRKIFFLILFQFTMVYGQVDLVKYLPENFSEKGDIDYTDYLQKGFDENDNLLLPNFPILINAKGLNLKSNQIVSFQNSSILIMKENDLTKYGMLNVINKDNVTINNATLIGDKDIHKGTKGEWGMGIKILSSSNVFIKEPIIKKTWGDGIYIGELNVVEKRDISKKSFTNNKITIKGGVIEDCLRNGISIISGIDIFIDGITIKNMSTKAPRAAIDIEPNTKFNKIRNVSITNVITRDNFNGIVIMLVNLIDTNAVDIGTVLIENHSDFNSKSSLVIANYANKLERKDKLKSLKGEIAVVGSKYFGTKNVYKHKKMNLYNPKITFKNINYYSTKENSYVLSQDFNNQFKYNVENDPKVICK